MKYLLYEIFFSVQFIILIPTFFFKLPILVIFNNSRQMSEMLLVDGSNADATAGSIS